LLSIAAVYITFFHMKMSISSDPKLNKHCVIYCSWRESVWMWFPVFCDCWCRMMDREGVCVCVEGGVPWRQLFVYLTGRFYIVADEMYWYHQNIFPSSSTRFPCQRSTFWSSK